jgi:hypothetical protein
LRSYWENKIGTVSGEWIYPFDQAGWFDGKRQRAAALQDLSESGSRRCTREVSWSAAALCRFPVIAVAVELHHLAFGFLIAVW